MEKTMRLKFITFSVIILISIIGFSCSSSEPNTNSANINIANSNLQTNQPVENVETNSKNVLNTTSTPKIATTNEAPTLTPVYKAFCDAMKNKNETALRKLLTKDTQEYWEKEMSDEGKDIDLVTYISETEPIKDPSKCGVRNEKITGNTAVAEIRNENVPNGFVIKFVKENGEWKITNQSPEFEK